VNSVVIAALLAVDVVDVVEDVVVEVVVALVGGGEGLFANGGNCPFLCPINESHFNGSLLFFC